MNIVPVLHTSAVHKILTSLLASLALLLAPASSPGAQPKNYWLVSSTGQVFAYGKARTHGSEYRKHYRGVIKGIKATPDHKGQGYWIITTKAHYGFGDASHYKYRARGLKTYTGKQHPKGLKGKIVGYAVASIPAANGGRGGGTTVTTPTTTTPTVATATLASTTPTPPPPAPTTTSPTTTPPTTPAVDCSSVAIQTSTLSSAMATVAYSQTLTAGGISGGSWAWTIQSGNLPSGLSLSSAGTIAGTPAQSTAGTQSTFTVQATNSQCPGSLATRSFTVSVLAPISITTAGNLPDATYGQPYSLTFAAAGGTGSGYQWSYSSDFGLPPGLSLSSNGVLSGTPTQTTNGYTDTLEITVTDPGGHTATKFVGLNVNDPPMQITSPSSLGDGQATVAYSNVQFTATGGTPGDTSSNYQWTASGLPTGMSMSSTGVLSGTPSTPGSYTVAVTVTDQINAANRTTVNFPLHVNYAPLAFVTSTLTAIKGQAYTGQVVAQGGEAPYTMYRLAGMLPPGMSFNNGTITVASTVAAGDYQFTVGLTDSQSSPATAQETFNMWVAPSQVAPGRNVISNANGTIWAGYVGQASTAFTSVSGTLTVPTIETTPANEVSPWIGIDGYGTSNLIQAGVTAQVNPPYAPTYEAWWETAGSSGSPQNRPPQDQFAAAPGDTINVNIWQVSAGQWEMTLDDLTSGQGFAVQVSYTGTDDTAEWIVENSAGAPAVGYGATSTFSNLQASQAVTGILDLSITGATPSSLTSSGFSITDYN